MRHEWRLYLRPVGITSPVESGGDFTDIAGIRERGEGRQPHAWVRAPVVRGLAGLAAHEPDSTLVALHDEVEAVASRSCRSNLGDDDLRVGGNPVVEARHYGPKVSRQPRGARSSLTGMVFEL